MFSFRGISLDLQIFKKRKKRKLTLKLFSSQQISFMLTLLSKVIHPRLKNLQRKLRNVFYIFHCQQLPHNRDQRIRAVSDI